MGTITRNFANNLTTSGLLKPSAFNNDSFDNITAVPSGSVESNSMQFISSQTASASSTVEFTTGLDSTYKEYIFYFDNLHPSNDTVGLEFQGSTNGGVGYGVAMTSTYFLSRHAEDGGSSELSYKTTLDSHNNSGNCYLSIDQKNYNDSSVSGFFHLFNPSSTTFSKHWIARTQQEQNANTMENYTSGYFNTTEAIDAIRFGYNSGNVDSGTIRLYGIV
jgi:hypothetical protein